MKKYLMILVCIVYSGFIISFGQAADVDPSSGSNEIKNAKKGLVYKYINPTKDIKNEYAITGTSIASFSVSNKSDGTQNSFKHTQRIILKLLTANKNDNIELIFYSDAEELPYSVSQVNDVISVYYPFSMYEGIKQKIDETLSAKKKVTLKVELKTDGYREGQLIF